MSETKLAKAVGDNIKSEPSYTKQSFLKSEKYKDKKDLISVLLDDNKSYTKTDVNRLIDSYLKRRVK